MCGAKGFTRNATTEHLSRHGDMHTYGETWRFYGLASVSTETAVFLWAAAKWTSCRSGVEGPADTVLRERRRRSCRYGLAGAV